LILVTGNVADLARSDVRVLNPFDPSGRVEAPATRSRCSGGRPSATGWSRTSASGCRGPGVAV